MRGDSDAAGRVARSRTESLANVPVRELTEATSLNEPVTENRNN